MKPFEEQRPHERRGRAHVAVARAIRHGVLIRPSRCEECLGPCKPDAAHFDYRDPLRVRWLCRGCHQRWDRALPKNSGATGWQRRIPNPKTQMVFVKLPKAAKAVLVSEAEEAKRKLSDYIRILLETHPDRLKRGK